MIFHAPLESFSLPLNVTGSDPEAHEVGLNFVEEYKNQFNASSCMENTKALMIFHALLGSFNLSCNLLAIIFLSVFFPLEHL